MSSWMVGLPPHSGQSGSRGSAFHGLPSLFQGWPSIVGPMNLMAVTSPRGRTWSPGRVPNRFLLLGLALVLAVGGAYAALGNPFARSQATPTYQTTAAALGTVQVTVSASGPITTP